MKKLTKESNGKKYISVKGVNREVIGVMGDSNRTTVFDDTFYINNLLEEENLKNVVLVGGNYINRNVEAIVKALKNKSEKIEIEIFKIDTIESLVTHDKEIAKR